MADKEMFDYLTDTVADYTSTTLSVVCQVDIEEEPHKNQKTHKFDSAADDVIVNLSETIWFEGYLQWQKGISTSVAGTVLDFYADSNKADMLRRSIYWEHPTDGHTYVIRFTGPLVRRWSHDTPGYLRIPKIPIKIIGRKAE